MTANSSFLLLVLLVVSSIFSQGRAAVLKQDHHHQNNGNLEKPLSSKEFVLGATSANAQAKQLSSLVPGPPATMNISVIDSKSVYVSWTEPKDTSGPLSWYKLEWTWNVHQTGHYNVNKAFTASIVSPPFPPYADCEFTLSSCTYESNCGETISQKARTHTAAPGSPHLKADKAIITSNTIQVEWDKPDVFNGPLDGYLVHIVPSSGGAATIRPTQTSWKAENLTPLTEYKVSVQAFNLDSLDRKKQLLGPNDTATIKTHAAGN